MSRAFQAPEAIGYEVLLGNACVVTHYLDRFEGFEFCSPFVLRNVLLLFLVSFAGEKDRWSLICAFVDIGCSLWASGFSCNRAGVRGQERRK